MQKIKNWQKDYPNIGDITEESLDENSSIKKMLHFIGEGKQVVDFGCATGYLAHLLQKKNCIVTGIEINPDAAKVAEKYCQQVIVADLDFVSITDILPNQKFDVAIFGDVLEHLRNPWKVLEQTKDILKEHGFVVASIPNIAHGAIRLALLQGKFDYTKLGILDDTHLRFFTCETTEELFKKSGYLVDEVARTKLPVFSDSDLVPKLNANNFSQEVIQYLQQDKDIDTLQFIVRAFPLSQESKYSILNTKYEQVLIERNTFQSQLQQTQVELERSQSQLQHTQSELERSQSQLQHTQAQLAAAQNTITAMKSSKFWRIRTIWFNFRCAIGLVDTHLPLNQSVFSRAKYLWAVFRVKGFRYSFNKLLKKIFFKFDNTPQPALALPDIPHANDANYQKWLNINYPTQDTLQKMSTQVDLLAYKPVISIIMPVFNTPVKFLKEAIDSVLSQIYPYWELCIADDASTDNQIKQILADYSSKDSRIKVVFRLENGHISSCSNSAIEIATGEFISLFDHDDLLTPDALYEVAMLLNKYPDADMIYSDEDKMAENGKLQAPFFKPDWCPDSFLSRMYTCHLGTYRRELVEKIGGFRIGYEGSQDYDLVLRLTEKTTRIFHIPKILYHWRIHPQSAASKADQKPYAVIAAEKALADALVRRGEDGRVTEAKSLTVHHIIRYTIKDYKLVSIIIPTRDLGNMLDKCLTSIFEKTTYPNYEVILIDNGSQEENTFRIFSKWQQKEPNRFQCHRLDIPFNYSKINNYAVNQAKGDYLLFLNNDIEVITPDWIDAMVEQAQRLSIGAIGALLLYPDNTIQHAGVVIGIGGVAGHSHKHYPGDSPGYFDQILTVNNYSAVTAACLMCRREVFEAVGGFEEELAVAFNDVDLCLKIVEKGYRNIYLPHVILYHYESKSRGYDDTPAKLARFMKETEHIQNKWKKFIEYDPCYSINLTSKHENYSINI